MTVWAVHIQFVSAQDKTADQGVYTSAQAARGAAVYEAKVYWEGAQLKREIEGGEAFRLRETFFLSQDANRLFVILRVGDPPRQSDRNNPAPIHGFNRVYDRVREGAGGSGPGF